MPPPPLKLDRALWSLLGNRPADVPVHLCGLGGSMRPFLRENDEVAVVRTFDSLHLGDLVVADLGERGLALHRILAFDGERVLVKGDANPQPDGWVPCSAILARAVALRRVGGRLRDLDSPSERLLARLIALASPHSPALRRLALPAWRTLSRVRRR